MGFRTIRNCRRPAWAQEMTYLTVMHLDWMPPAIRSEAYGLIQQIARDSTEGRALFELLTKDKTVDAVYERFRISKTRLYQMRKEFYERFLSGTICRR